MILKIPCPCVINLFNRDEQSARAVPAFIFGPYLRRHPAERRGIVAGVLRHEFSPKERILHDLLRLHLRHLLLLHLHLQCVTCE